MGKGRPSLEYARLHLREISSDSDLPNEIGGPAKQTKWIESDGWAVCAQVKEAWHSSRLTNFHRLLKRYKCHPANSSFFVKYRSIHVDASDWLCKSNRQKSSHSGWLWFFCFSFFLRLLVCCSCKLSVITKSLSDFIIGLCLTTTP